MGQNLVQFAFVMLLVYIWARLAKWLFPRVFASALTSEVFAVSGGLALGAFTGAAYAPIGAGGSAGPPIIGAALAGLITLLLVRREMEPQKRCQTERSKRRDGASHAKREPTPWKDMERRFAHPKFGESNLTTFHGDEGGDVVSSAIGQPSSPEKKLPEMTFAERFAYLEQKQAEENARIDAKFEAKAKHETSDQRKCEPAERHKSLKQTEDDLWYPSVPGKTMALARLVVRSFLRKITDEEKQRLLAMLLVELNEEEFALQDEGAKDEEMFELLVSSRTLQVLERWREKVIDEMRMKSGEEMLQAQSFVTLVTETYVDEMERRGLAPD